MGTACLTVFLCVKGEGREVRGSSVWAGAEISIKKRRPGHLGSI
jgi:hypothetical protein